MEQIEDRLDSVKLALADVLRSLGTMHEAQTTANKRLDKVVAEMKQVVVWCMPIGVGVLIAILGTLRNWF
jgi:hypothetical protein